jgi:hypothetical protein
VSSHVTVDRLQFALTVHNAAAGDYALRTALVWVVDRDRPRGRVLRRVPPAVPAARRYPWLTMTCRVWVWSSSA